MHLVESSNKHPKIFILHATDERSRNALFRLVPAQVFHFFIMTQLHEAWLLCRGRSGQGMARGGTVFQGNRRFSLGGVVDSIGVRQRHQVLVGDA